MKTTPEPSSRKTSAVAQKTAQAAPANYWNIAPEQLLTTLHAVPTGLQQAEAEQRLKQYGLNTIRAQQRTTALRLLLSQFKSPLVLILIFAAIVSGVVGEWVDASIVLAIVLGSTILGFLQEYTASNAVEKLRSQVTIKSSVLRGGQPQTLPPNKWCQAMWWCSPPAA